MCLSTTLKNPLKAKEEIAVYKVIDQFNAAPYYEDYAYSLGFNKASGPKQVERDRDCGGYRCEVNGGFLHAYTDEESAKRFAYRLNGGFPSSWTNYKREYRVVKMYVPVGTKYYTDSFNDEICAEKLLWREEKEEE